MMKMIQSRTVSIPRIPPTPFESPVSVDSGNLPRYHELYLKNVERRLSAKDYFDKKHVARWNVQSYKTKEKRPSLSSIHDLKSIEVVTSP